MRGQHLDRDHALQRLVEGAEDDAEAAPTEDFENLVMPDPPERTGMVGRLQEFEIAGLLVRYRRIRPGIICLESMHGKSGLVVGGR